jgi:hypothetical protein
MPPMRPQQSSAQAFDELQDRVRALYGEFGNRAQTKEEEKVIDVAKEAWIKPTLKLVLPVGAVGVGLTYTVGTQTQILNLVLLAITGGLLWWLIAKHPVHVAARCLLAVSLFIESPAETPTWWLAPLRAVDLAFFESMKDFAGVPGMSLPIFFFACLGLLYKARRAAKKGGYLPPRVAVVVMLAFLGAVFALEGWGLARGGQLTPSFFQILHLMTMPVVGLMFLYAIRGPEDVPALGSIVVTVAVLRAAVLILVYSVVARDFRDREGFYVTTHSDTVLFVAGIIGLFTYALENRKMKTIAKCAGLGLVILAAIALNNRRLAFVSMGAFPIVMYVAMRPGKLKRNLTGLAVVAGILGAIYVVAGAQLGGDSALFKPARLIMSVMTQTDTSSESRDVENYNLIHTLRQSPVVGMGFGHGYVEQYHLFDIADLFALYLFIPHNGVLWIWAVGGVVGFTALWFVYPVAGTMAMRAYRGAKTPLDRMSGLTALGTVIACVAQVWGDQGFNSYMTLTLFALAYAISVRTDAAQGVRDGR